MIELPDLVVPRPIAKAASVVREREADVKAARASGEEAKQAVQAAAGEDRALLADALDRGEGDPGNPKTDAANERVAEAERLLAAEELRQQRAREALDAALAQSIEAWVQAVTKSVEEAEIDVLDLLDQLANAEHERARRRHALAWLRAYRQGEKLPNIASVPISCSTLVRNAQASPYERLPVDDLLAHVRAGVERSTLASEAKGVAEREQQRAARLPVA
jgi:hypothetical protein